MKLAISKRDKLILLAAILLLVLLIVYAQFLKLSPLHSDLESQQQTLKTEQKLLEAVSRKKADSSMTVAENTRELQKVLPVNPLQEQLILDLEKAEAVSNSQILSMGFSKDGAVAAAEPQTDSQAAGNQQSTSNQANSNQNTGSQSQGTTPQTSTTASQGTDANSQASGDQAAQQAAAPALKKLTVQLSVEAPSYEEFEKFVETLETLKRIVVVESINYTGSKEVTTQQEETEKLTFSLTVSAFYMPELADLKQDLPKIDAEAPAGKTNPLSQFPTASTQP
ncbi:type 4a pilus biogenesis protein PilO [Neobacillus citreus]|uniref:Type 4a pilus biogenesis protein PilO n=1 Tax=Neobacillus citreus TaxID=2833578 RepID=A0A942T478_9BACI|nr:type 4a pilus biogenesis protein PilO [Neobacillus citreus]MCH6266695.1 type 4a pilus biogenesis protein PilO [Neobacillus citreus]